VDNSLSLQVGPNPGHILETRIGEVTRRGLHLENLLVVDRDAAQEAITNIDMAVTTVNSQRARIGAYVNRLNSTIRIIDIAQENMVASESRIRDLDIAQQTMDFTRDQIMTQAATAMLAQANALPQSVLQLLK
jgi:flagellin